MTLTTPTIPPNTTMPVDPLGSDLLALLRALKLSGLKDTLPERLLLAKSRQLSSPSSWSRSWATRSPAGRTAPRRPGPPGRG